MTVDTDIDPAYSAYATSTYCNRLSTGATVALIDNVLTPWLSTGTISLSTATITVDAPTAGSADHYNWGIRTFKIQRSNPLIHDIEVFDYHIILECDVTAMVKGTGANAMDL